MRRTLRPTKKRDGGAKDYGYLNPYNRGKRHSHQALGLSCWRVYDRDGKRLGADHHFHRVLFKAMEALDERKITRNLGGGGGGGGALCHAACLSFTPRIRNPNNNPKATPPTATTARAAVDHRCACLLGRACAVKRGHSLDFLLGAGDI